MSCELYKGISRPIDSFVKYFLDVKPYHTKILEILERYNFQENIDVIFDQSLFTEIDFINEPLCKPVGWGVDWDDDCGFDALSCCDLFDCIGGYGLIYDNSVLLASANIVSVDNVNDKIIVEGNLTYDIKFQIDTILNNNSLAIRGDHTSIFNAHSIFLIVPRHTYNIIQTTSQGFVVQGNRSSEFLTRRKFLVYASGNNDAEYNVKNASYDFVSNTTLIEVVEVINNPISLGVIEIKSSNKNNGIYQIDTVSFNGLDTIISVKTSVKQFDIVNDLTHGSVQLRTGFIYPRIVTFDNTLGPSQAEISLKILNSVYNTTTGNTEITVVNNIENLIPYGQLKLYGYGTPGFDADEECSSPKASNVHTIFAEWLKITITELTPPIPSITPTPALTLTPTPTVTLTPTNTSAITPTLTPTITPSVTMTVSPTVTPTPTVTPIIGDFFPMLVAWSTGGFFPFGYGDDMIGYVVYDEQCGYENNSPYHQDITSATIIGGTVKIYGNSGCGATYESCPDGQYIDVEGDSDFLISTTTITSPIPLQSIPPVDPEPIFENILVLNANDIPGYSSVSDGGLLADLIVNTNLGIMQWKIYYNNCI